MKICFIARVKQIHASRDPGNVKLLDLKNLLKCPLHILEAISPEHLRLVVLEEGVERKYLR